MSDIDFWYSIGSTYSYLTVSRISTLAQKQGVTIRWRPFNVRDIMVEQNNVPFKGKPIKTAYMWRDIERRAQLYGLNPKLPAPYPSPQLPYANQVAILGMEEGWGEDYTKTAYRNWFEQGHTVGEDPNLADSLHEIGQDPERVKAEAATSRIVDLLAEQTAQAKALGVFGSPSFVVADEVFWGDDRLEDAIAWLKHGRLGAS